MDDKIKFDESDDNVCIFCGEIIPEGRQVCPTCEELITDFNKIPN